MTELEMFAKLPKFDENYEASDIGDYLPTLTLADSLNTQYTISWGRKIYISCFRCIFYC